MKNNSDILRQDLSEEAQYSGVYIMWLLFHEKCDVPQTSVIHEKLKERFGDVDVVSGDSGMHSFALLSHLVTYEDGKEAASMVMMTDCDEIEKPHGDDIARTQFWDCQDGVELLDSCKYQVMFGDFMAGGLPALERADILADWLEIALELFPSCVAVYVNASGKLLTADRARSNPCSGPQRFIWFGLNVRFFSIQGTDDSLVDSLGLYALGLPDVQYHFHSLNPDDVVNHAYNTATYQFENDAPIQSGHTIGGLSEDSSWKCQYEHSLIQPSRDLLDIEMGEFAAGNRKK